MEDKEILVKVDGLYKKYCKDLKKSLWYGVSDLYTNVLGSKKERTLREQEFWAVKDINFELRRGECLGLIGHNGAGKSTLLKILNGLIKPDAGKVTIKGRVGALIELGAGFNPILTGRENIYNNGAVLGFTREEINNHLEEIIDFAEIREYIDMPVQNYSSGMKVRLGFSIAAQMKPDVLLIDEVLAVGDIGFILKCFKSIDTILPRTAIIFVSHSTPMVSRICNKILLMQNGLTKFQGINVAKGIDLYYSQFIHNESQVIFDDGTIGLEEVRLIDTVTGLSITQINWGEDLNLVFRIKLKKAVKEVPTFKIIIHDKEQRPVAVIKENDKDTLIRSKGGMMNFQVSHRKLQLSKGIYSIDLLVAEGRIQAPLLRKNNILSFQILYEKEIWPPFLLDSCYTSLEP